MTDGRQYQAGDTGMSELSREQIEWFRSKVMTYEDEYTRVLYGVCDMALRTRDAEADRDNYRAKFHDAEQRAQRAEAALRDAQKYVDMHSSGLELSYHISEILATPPPDGSDNPDLAPGRDPRTSATPPPESEPCDTCGGARKIAVDTPCPDCQGRGSKSAPHTPEQAHGDALAALQKLTYAAWAGGGMDSEEVNPLHAEIRRHLTASGVPYVPEEVRRLPDSWNDEGLRVNGATSEFDHGYKAAKYEDADALAKALASAPADGWKLVPVEPTLKMVIAGQTARHDTRGTQRGTQAESVYHAMIAAAPQRGGE